MRFSRPLRIAWTPIALADLKRLGGSLRDRMAGAIRRFAEEGLGDVVPLKGQPGRYRLRAGNWRILLTHLEEEQTLRVDAIRARGGAYRP